MKPLVTVLLLLLIGGSGWATDTGHVAETAPRGTDLAGSTERFYIEFRDAEIKEALRFLAKISGMNLVIPDNVEGSVNVAFEDVTILDAISAITKSNDFEYAIERGILRVGKKDQFTTSGEDLKTQTFRLKYALAKNMVDQIKSLLTQRGSVLADERTNSVVVRETVANLEQIKTFIDNVDIRDAQVMIEAKLVEATRDWVRNLGIQWGLNTSGGNKVNVVGVNAVGNADSGRILNVNLPAATPNSGLGLVLGTFGAGINIDAQITAAETKGDLHVISEPSIVTSNGVAARIRSGDTIYVKTAGTVNIGAASASGGGNSGLQKITTGVEMDVTPQISVGEYVKMEIKAATSAPDFTRTVDGIPAIIENEAKTTVLVRDGETTVIGGLIRLRGQETRRKVPFLGDIPMLGYLFQSRGRSKTNNDLLVFIKPSIVREQIQSPLQHELPHIHNVRREIHVEDAPHLPKPKAQTFDHKATQTRYRTRYERYRQIYGE